MITDSSSFFEALLHKPVFLNGFFPVLLNGFFPVLIVIVIKGATSLRGRIIRW